MTDKDGNRLWFGNYTDWGHLKKDEWVYKNVNQPLRLHNQYVDRETGLHYNFFRHYEPDVGWVDPLGLSISTVIHMGQQGRHIVPALPDIT